MSFTLAHEIITAVDASPSKIVFLLHGIFGSGRNWRSFARSWAERCPTWRIVAVDLRLHGASTGAPPPHTLAACADDLRRLADELGAPDAICGHSFGGKVTLAYAARCDHPLDAAWLLDSPPGAADTLGAPLDETEAGIALSSMRAVPVPATSRGDVTRAIARRGIAPSVATWLATNLVTTEGGYRFAFDFDGLAALLDDYWKVDGYRLLEEVPDATAVHLVRAGRSDRWSTAELTRVAALADRGRILVQELPDAAHWLHVDDPAGLLEILAPHFGGKS